MSLVGRLEDLGLAEILQIVALSGKSGILHITSKKREGKIYFYKGKVVTAYSDAYKINLGELLIHKGYITPEILKKALEFQSSSTTKLKLGKILIDKFNISKDRIEECVTELIEKSVFSLFYWHEGEFRFELADDIVEDTLTVDLLQYDLPKARGLNPQFLAMEGSRLLDEGQIETVVKEESEIKTITSELISPEPTIKPTLLIVDDNPVFLNLTKKFLEQKYETETANSIEIAFNTYKKLKNEGKKVVVIVSLFMRKDDGSGILGGLDLAEKLYNLESEKSIIVASEYSLAEAEERLRSLKINVIKKPKRSQLTKENVMDLVGFYIKAIEAIISESFAPFEQKTLETPWDKELKEEFEIKEENKSTVVTTPGLTILKSMIAELSQVTSGNEIILLILRLASEIMPRGILFAIKSEAMHGLGQFGLEKFISQPLKVVKSLALPINGFFKNIIDAGIPYKSSPPEDEIFSNLLEKLGNQKPTEIFLAPIISGGKTVALFYGDNLPDCEPIRDTDALEIFLSQAGITMERLLLEKKIKGENI